MTYTLEELEKMRKSHTGRYGGTDTKAFDISSLISGVVGIGLLGFGFEEYGVYYLTTSLIIYGGGKLAVKLIRKKADKDFYNLFKKEYDGLADKLN